MDERVLDFLEYLYTMIRNGGRVVTFDDIFIEELGSLLSQGRPTTVWADFVRKELK